MEWRKEGVPVGVLTAGSPDRTTVTGPRREEELNAATQFLSRESDERRSLSVRRR
jgi:hypothetical protein